MDWIHGTLRRLTLRVRLIAVMLILFGLSMAASYLVSVEVEKSALQEIQSHVDTLAKAIEVSVQQLPVGGRSKQQMLLDYQSRLHLRGVEDITILDANRRVLASTLNMPLGATDLQVLPGMVLSERFYTYELTIPVVSGEDLLGYIHLHLALDNFKALFQQMLYSKLMFSLVLFGTGILVLFPLVSYLMKPIQGLTVAVQQVADGKLDVSVPGSQIPDLAPLVSGFKEMISRLKTQKELETRLRENEKAAALGHMASGIAHDVRNPINFVALALDHVARKTKGSSHTDAQLERLLADAHSELMRVSAMIQEFLDFGRVGTPSLEPGDAAEILAASRDQVLRRRPGEVCDITLQLNGGAFPVNVDRSLLERALGNLLENALEAGGGAASPVQAGVQLDSESDEVVIWVQDSGSGIPEEDLPRIFNPYFTTKQSGVGLGLALARKWILEMNGTVEALNLPSGGARFEVRLPRDVA
jgi:signal transduction histidine kinase